MSLHFLCTLLPSDNGRDHLPPIWVLFIHHRQSHLKQLVLFPTPPIGKFTHPQEYHKIKSPQKNEQSEVARFFQRNKVFPRFCFTFLHSSKTQMPINQRTINRNFFSDSLFDSISTNTTHFFFFGFQVSAVVQACLFRECWCQTRLAHLNWDLNHWRRERKRGTEGIIKEETEIIKNEDKNSKS